MIIRFENIDNPSYSAQFTFDNNGFICAEYDYSDFFDVTDPDLTVSNSFTEFLIKIEYNIFTDDFVAVFSGIPGHNGEIWHSFKVNFTSGDFRKFYYEGFNSWVQNDFDSINACSCTDVFDSYEGWNSCPNNVYQDFVDDSWVSSKCMKISRYFEPLDKLSIGYYNFLDDHGDMPCIYKGFLPVISFKEPDLNYPRFRIFAYDFNNFTNDDCKYGLFLHVFYLDSNNNKKIKTIKIGSFGVFQGDFYFENFYGNKVTSFPERYFNFYDFFNTNTSDNVVDFMKDDFNDLDIININSFGNDFVFELKKEDYSGVYMSTLDCECLTTAINSLNSTLEGLFKDSNEDSIADTVSDIKDCLLGGLNGVSNSSNLGSVFMSTKCNRKIADSFDYVFTDVNCDSLVGNFISSFNSKGLNCNNAIYFKQCDNDNIGSSCNKPLYLNVCDLPALKFNDLFNRVDIVGALDVNVLSQPFDYASVLSSIVTALGNLLKPSDTVNVAVSSVPNVNVSSFPSVVIDSTNPIDIDLGFGSDCNNPLNVNLCPFTFSEVPVRINSIPSLTGAFDIDIDTMPGTFNVNHLNDAVDISCICDELDEIDKGLVAEFGALGLALSNGLSGIANKFVTSCETTFGEAFSEAFNLTNCLGSVFKANDNFWNEEDTLAGIWYKQLDYDYNYSAGNNKSSFLSFNNNRLLGFSQLIRNAFFDNTSAYPEYSVFNFNGSGQIIGLGKMFKRAFFSILDADVPHHFSSVLSFGRDSNFDVYKILNHSCNVNPNSIKFCESVSQPSIPVEISSPVQISQPEDEWGEPVPFKMDWKPLLDLLSEALFCQFGNDGLDPRASWGYSVFNKLLYPLHAEGCDDKVGLPELDFSEGFIPDNIFVNSNGLIARFNSEIYK